ncbi:MAG: type II toxin-antitoxin system VapC family toxin [Planctomycetes bacterium]|nr:type II toxin-antitoxin system VapC family toxin [Planctomycetota bacterium]
MEPARLPEPYSTAIAEPQNALTVSVASIWELSIKQRLGKLATTLSLGELVRRGLDGIEVLPVGLAHVVRLHELPMLHRDPFDRMIVAQAFSEGLTLLTVDAALPPYGVPILPVSNPR